MKYTIKYPITIFFSLLNLNHYGVISVVIVKTITNNFVNWNIAGINIDWQLTKIKCWKVEPLKWLKQKKLMLNRNVNKTTKLIKLKIYIFLKVNQNINKYLNSI